MPLLLTKASLKGPAEQGNQSQRQIDGRRTPGITQHIPIGPGPPWHEHYAPAIPVRVIRLSTPFPRVHIQPFLLCL